MFAKLYVLYRVLKPRNAIAVSLTIVVLTLNELLESAVLLTEMFTRLELDSLLMALLVRCSSVSISSARPDEMSVANLSSVLTTVHLLTTLKDSLLQWALLRALN